MKDIKLNKLNTIGITFVSCSLIFNMMTVLSDETLTDSLKDTHISFSSKPTQVRFIELFSSEGCSSCPPADLWISTLRNQTGNAMKLWRDFVPIKFQVDYWNKLGWTDKLSKQAFTERQNNYMSEWGQSQVYTPAFVLDGGEWKPRGSFGNLVRDLAFLRSESPSLGNSVGILKVESLEKSKRKFQVVFEFSPETKKTSKGKWVIYGALLGNGIRSEVRSGENGGKTLNHEFVVLSMIRSPPSEKLVADMNFEEFSKAKSQIVPKSYSIAFWISPSDSQKPIQVVGGDIE